LLPGGYLIVEIGTAQEKPARERRQRSRNLSWRRRSMTSPVIRACCARTIEMTFLASKARLWTYFMLIGLGDSAHAAWSST
jgi:hypothetical protein